ncbi:hypothetical protein OFC62_40145, partial [Escherichia coli]|nr:hypothetical protein [Escherichia coli]
SKRGIFELENATGKNSSGEGFGQKRVSDFAKLEFNGLPEVRQTLDLSAHFCSSTKNNRGNVLRIPFPINN